jgi:adenylate cyclase
LSVVGAIEPSLRHAEIERSKRKRPDNLDAYDLYLRALPHAQVAMPGDGEKALSWLHKALDLEPDYAAAHALAAWCYEQRYLRGGMHEADKIAGLKHARTALATGADDPTTLATAGFVIGLVEHDYQTAMIAIDHALALNGSSALALGLGATILAHDGRIAQAIDYGERALRLSPHDPTVYLQLTALGIAHLAAGRFAEAAAVCNKACQSNPRAASPLCCARQPCLTSAAPMKPKLRRGVSLSLNLISVLPNSFGPTPGDRRSGTRSAKLCVKQACRPRHLPQRGSRRGSCR